MKEREREQEKGKKKRKGRKKKKKRGKGKRKKKKENGKRRKEREANDKGSQWFPSIPNPFGLQIPSQSHRSPCTSVLVFVSRAEGTPWQTLPRDLLKFCFVPHVRFPQLSAHLSAHFHHWVRMEAELSPPPPYPDTTLQKMTSPSFWAPSVFPFCCFSPPTPSHSVLRRKNSSLFPLGHIK